ncbi:unnamed protein product [Hymenolepis diminuta]|uniref:Uncharacterized protein n=1 Tax=Hymenolepis diminuta TaxID=6216 RepID=A0A564YC76_HYMDI|nr:unnamed protein product [Hymenolepis diminuta]
MNFCGGYWNGCPSIRFGPGYGCFDNYFCGYGCDGCNRYGMSYFNPCYYGNCCGGGCGGRCGCLCGGCCLF